MSASGSDPAVLDPRVDLKLVDVAAVSALSERGVLMSHRAALPCHTCPGTPPQYQLVRSKRMLQERLEHIKHTLSDDSLQQVGSGGEVKGGCRRGWGGGEGENFAWSRWGVWVGVRVERGLGPGGIKV